MSCRLQVIGQCNPKEPGGCPCAVVVSNGGPLTADEIGEVLGLTGRMVRSIVTGALAKLARNRKARQWKMLLEEEWPETRSCSRIALAQSEPTVGFDPRPMYRHLVRKFKELGWKGSDDRLFAVPRRGHAVRCVGARRP